MAADVRSLLFIVRSDDTFPSCRFRAYQFAAPLRRLGVRVDFLRASRSFSPLRQAAYLRELARVVPQYDAVIYQKMLHPAHIAFVRTLNPNLYYDIDDALWITHSERRFALTVRAAPAVIAGNSMLAEHTHRYNRRTFIVPTTVIVPEAFEPAEASGPFVLSWVGSAVNLRYLEPVRSALRSLRERGLDLLLHVVTEAPEVVELEPGVTVERWSHAVEERALRSCHVGLMPLSDDEWSRGKCACKALQYLSYGRPIATSPVGVNRQIFADAPFAVMPSTDREWRDALASFYEARSSLHAIGHEGRAFVQREFSVDVWAPRLLEVLSSGSADRR